MSPKALSYMDGETLMSTTLPPIRFIVENLIPQGLNILAGSAKTGKSWLSLWLCLRVALGEPVWGFATNKTGVLYLCLEDSYTRIQNRLLDFTDYAPANLFFATVSEKLREGLEEQVEGFLSVHPCTGFVVIDTLQRVRSLSNDLNAYAADYRDLVSLKELADKHGVAILVIHHVRKLSDDDPFNMISGTTGISGAADSSFVLRKDKRGGSSATLFCTGRDIEYRELKLEFDSLTHIWNLVEDSGTEEAAPDDSILRSLSVFVKERITFQGTATELAEELERQSGEKHLPNVLMKHLVRHGNELAGYGIVFERSRTRERRELKLSLICDYSDGNDGNDGKIVCGPVSNLLSQPSQLSPTDEN